MAAPGNRIGKKEKNEDFYKAILLLKDEEECYATISRVARSLTDSDGGYERIFARMKGEK